MKYTDPDGRTATGTVLGWIGTDTAIPEPTDCIPWKWVGYGVAIAGALAIDYFASKAISNSLSKTSEKNNNKEYVYHVTGNIDFANNLKKEPSSVIDFSYSSPDSRFGSVFYAASDPATANLEATAPGITVKMKMSDTANILDLTNPEIASKYGYKKGMSRDDARYLMRNWNLTGIDAIKYESEKNPAGYNYAILNTFILSPAGD